ncbi:MAG: hypothetical protein LBR44_04885, partial [Clostridiales Family XIII bacterium]|nr:hypothetical protein [Clostridiales Family XIII bacterium]
QAGRVDAPDKVASLPKAGRDGLLLLLKQQGITVRQLSRLTGINRGIVQRAQNVSDYTSP